MTAANSYLVLANDRAGSTQRAAVSAAVARLAEFAPTELRWTRAPDEFGDAVARMPEARRVVVAGGDGSIHLALQTMDRTDRTHQPVGIIPLGTGNDFARNHDIPLGPVEAADVVVHGAPRSIAAIEIAAGAEESRELAANNFHLGLGVHAARIAKPLKPALGRLSYPVSAAVQGLRIEGSLHRVSVDGTPVWDAPVLVLLVLLWPSVGGGVELTETEPDALDVVVVEGVPRRKRLAVVADALRSRLAEADGAHRWTGQQVELSRPGGIDADLDGELVHLDDPVRLRRRPNAWRVIAPVST